MESGRRFPAPRTLVSRLAGSASHDLNNLISVLSGHIYLLRQTSGAEAAESLDALQTAVGQLERLSRNLAILGTTGAPEGRAISVNDVVRRVAERHTSSAELQLDLAEPLPPLAGSDADVSEALDALIVNAIEASAPKSPIRLSTRREPRAVVLEVEDSGKGIAPGIAERVFDPFFSTKGGRGQGMGLFLAAVVAGAHGGECRLESREQGGTRASLSLPLSAEA